MVSLACFIAHRGVFLLAALLDSLLVDLQEHLPDGCAFSIGYVSKFLVDHFFLCFIFFIDINFLNEE